MQRWAPRLRRQLSGSCCCMPGPRDRGRSCRARQATMIARATPQQQAAPLLFLGTRPVIWFRGGGGSSCRRGAAVNSTSRARSIWRRRRRRRRARACRRRRPHAPPLLELPHLNEPAPIPVQRDHGGTGLRCCQRNPHRARQGAELAGIDPATAIRVEVTEGARKLEGARRCLFGRQRRRSLGGPRRGVGSCSRAGRQRRLVVEIYR